MIFRFQLLSRNLDRDKINSDEPAEVDEIIDVRVGYMENVTLRLEFYVFLKDIPMYFRIKSKTFQKFQVYGRGRCN